MNEQQDKINELFRRLSEIIRKQDIVQQEINGLRNEIMQLRSAPEKETLSSSLQDLISEANKKAEIQEVKPEPVSQPVKYPVIEPSARAAMQPQQRPTVVRPVTINPSTVKSSPKASSDLEKFIGQNLINKIGIAILIIGVAIGVKYAIDHNLINPLTRIILGYITGLGLLGFAFKLKKNYLNFSSVLLSGAMAIMYFVTYAAYSFYRIIPLELTFILMVAYTAFTVFAAIKYNIQAIAHIGLVGAYAVPFLLSDNSGNVHILFSYMAMINIGILIIAFKKYWKPLYYVAFALTWIIYASWYIMSYKPDRYFTIAFTFLLVFFLTFYIMFMAYKIIRKERYGYSDIALVLVNSFVFYGFGYNILSRHATGMHLLGLFTLATAVIHFIVSVIIYRQKLADRNLFYFTAVLVLTFITIAVPVQLKGHWITLAWVVEAALLFWIGRDKKIAVYEKISYILMALAFISLVQDWVYWNDNTDSFYGMTTAELQALKIKPVLNIHFLSNLIFAAVFSFITYFSYKTKKRDDVSIARNNPVTNFIVPAICMVVVYCLFLFEVINYWNNAYIDSAVIRQQGGANDITFNYDLQLFKDIWIVNYSLLFMSVFTIINIRKIKNETLSWINIVLNTIAIVAFLTLGLYTLSELRESYFHPANTKYYVISSGYITIRYISIAFAILLIMATALYNKPQVVKRKFTLLMDVLVYLFAFWVVSSEFINIMDLIGSGSSYKLGLSILWGFYSLFLIIMGIWKKKKHLRIAAIVLFGITLIKLFFYDLTRLDTITKTVVFISLGILLLIISFLYNKYKNTIFGNDEQPENNELPTQD